MDKKAYLVLEDGTVFEGYSFGAEKNTLKMRVWERGNGETFACGTGACAAVAAACETGKCNKGEDITVKVKGGDLIVNYTDEKITLTGDAVLVFDGITEY